LYIADVGDDESKAVQVLHPPLVIRRKTEFERALEQRDLTLSIAQ
jgi:hypothetical protein